MVSPKLGNVGKRTHLAIDQTYFDTFFNPLNECILFEEIGISQNIVKNILFTLVSP